MLIRLPLVLLLSALPAHAEKKKKAPLPKPAKIVVASALLSTLTAADRIEFLEDMTFINGEIVSLHLKPLEKNLGPEEVRAVVAALSGPKDSPVRQKRPAKAELYRLKDLLSAAPPAARAEFLDSLAFRDGVLVSARIAGLRAALGEKALNALLARVAVSEEKSVCGDGWCKDSICTLLPNEHKPKCLPENGATCHVTCRR